MADPRPSTPKHFFREPIQVSRTGFILMPFSDDFADVHKAIRAGIKAAGLTPHRAGDIYQPGVVMEEVLGGIGAAEVVVADMSQKNPNVFYEVGIAHSFKDNVILLTQNTEDIPFDLRHLQHIRYDPTGEGLLLLTEELGAAIRGLPPEPASLGPPAQGGAARTANPSDARRELRRLLRECDREWKTSVVPSQAEVLRDKFGDNHSFTNADLAEALALLQPAFLAPWAPIEELGFAAIDRQENMQPLVPELVEALAQAYALRWERGEPTLVVGHGPILALRTWTLWGAYALDCEDWDTVKGLLHLPTDLGLGQQESFAENKSLHHPDVVYQDALIAAESIYDQTDDYAELRFGNLEALQAYTGLWLFAAGVAHSVAAAGKQFDYPLFPTWALAPRRQFERLLARLGTDTGYAAHFSRAVAQVDPGKLNDSWRGGLRERIHQYGRQDLRGPLPRLPAHFAE